MKKILLITSLFIYSIHFGQITGTSQEVGTTNGKLAVSLTGAATYNIPIAVPPGINGVAPQISLTYSSQSGNGVAGYGWNISGVSTITRIPATKFHDGFIDGVDFDQHDRFALDGQRLILKSGTYGADGAVYETENYSNIKVVSYGSNPEGPIRFEVFYPDGSKALYSYYSSSKSEWSIQYFINPQDIRIFYSYWRTNNKLRLKGIEYGGLGEHESSINFIDFIYKNRNRPEQAYINGHSFKDSFILDEIKIRGNTGFRNYYLEHNTTSLGYERLTKITEKNGNNSLELNPTLFTYEDTTNTDLFEHTESNSHFTSANATNSSYISGDFDGDTKMDFIIYPKTGSDKKRKYWLKKINNSQNFPILHDLGYQFEEIFPVSFLYHNSKFAEAQGWSVVKEEGSTYKFKVYSNGITNPIQYQYEKSIDFPTVNVITNCDESNCITTLENKIIPKKILSGDFNGDGLTDVIAIDKGLISFRCEELFFDDHCVESSSYIDSKKVYFVDLKRNTTNSWSLAGDIASFLPRSEDDYTIQVTDFNGDGKSDFMIFTDNKVTVYSLDNNNQLVQLAAITNDSDIDLDKPILMGDYNGDGKLDFVIPKQENQDSWNFYFSKGDSFHKKTDAIDLTYLKNKTGFMNGYSVRIVYNYISVDMNADGKTDILTQTNVTRTYGGNPVYCHLSLSENLNANPSTIEFNTSSNGVFNILGVKPYPLPIFLNQNTPNQNLEYALISDNKIHHFKHSKDHKQDVLLREITTGNGVKESIDYKPLKYEENLQDEIGIYRPTYDEIYPYINIKNVVSFQVVSKLKKQIAGQSTKQVFSYYGAVSNAEGLGFLGFKSILRSNWYNTDYTPIANVSIYDLKKRGAITTTYSMLNLTSNFENIPTDFINKTTNNYTSTLSATKVFKLINNSSINYNGLQNTSTHSNISYDNYNNPLTSTVLTKENGVTQNTTVTTLEYEHNPTGSPYYIGRVKKKITNSIVGSDNFSSEEQFTYNNTMLLTKHKQKGHNTPFIINNYTYDTYGNILTKTVLARSIANRTSSFQYDTTGRFLTKSTDIEGLETNFTYDFNGYLLTETNPFNLMTRYEYDTWGKKVIEIDYLGNTTNTIYSIHGNTSGRVQVHTGHPGGSKSYKQFDQLGRVIITATFGFRDNWDYTQINYNIYDSVISSSQPYHGWGNATQFNYNTYDVYGRQTQIALFNGKTTDISFSGLTTVATDGTKTATTVKNALGQIVSLTDDGGTILYNYYANGKLKQSNFDGNLTTLEYDGWGRKTKLIDSSAGKYTYEYNILGETTKETTPKGQTIYTLDNVGKLQQKKVTGDHTNLVSNYIYDTNTKLLNSITTNQNTTYTYAYDNYKRLKKTTEQNNLYIYQNTITFDDFGRTNTERKKTTYIPDNKVSDLTTKNNYKNGALWKILNNANQALLWKVNTINTRGQITNAQYGNTIEEVSNYDNYGLPTQNKSSKNRTDIIDLNYNFDHTKGLLLSRSNSLFNFNETFQYDNLDRLTHFTNAQGQQETQNYDTKGRITTNKIGNYNYSQSKPYQNTSIALTNFGKDYYEDRPLQTVSYNAFKAPVIIRENGFDRLNFKYNIFQQRSFMHYDFKSSDGVSRVHNKTKFYSWDGSTEVKITRDTNQIEFITYIGGDAYSAPVIYKTDGRRDQFQYLHRDYLGSIVAITNQQGNIIEKRAFDAWGNTAFLQDGQGNNLEKLTVIDRGYTGHEHLAEVKLINMNARLYDAKTHRFLAPDNYVTDPYNTQNYNRYSYVLNNPLSYTDPSGNTPLAVAFIIGAIIGGASAVISGGDIFSIVNGALLGGFIGVLSAGVGNLAVGGAFTSNAAASTVGFWSGAAAGGATGFTAGFLGTTVAAMQNGNGFGNALLKGLKGGLISGVIGGAIGGVVGGVRANNRGLDFFGADRVTDANLLDASFGFDDVACLDCSFEVGDSLSDFRADLSGKNDYGQLMKAYKKAYIYNDIGKNVTWNDIVDINISEKSILANGWKNYKSLPLRTKIFRHLKVKGSKAVIYAPKSSNQLITNVGRYKGTAPHIGLLGSPIGIASKPISKIVFETAQWQWSNRILKYLRK